MRIIPFGEVKKNLFETSKKYKLIECDHQIWRLTPKCKKNYETISFIEFLRGKIQEPKRIDISKKRLDAIGELSLL